MRVAVADGSLRMQEDDQEVPRAGTAPRTSSQVGVLIGSIAAALALRIVYLLRFGWDIAWMNLVYLERAKDVWLHGWTALGTQPPFTPLALVALHGLGLSPLHTVHALYLCAHVLLAYGIVTQAIALWPQARRRLTLVGGIVVVTPLLSTVAGYRNVGALAGAALFAAAFAEALRVARGGSAWRLPVAVVLAAAGCTARYEAFAGAVAAVPAFLLAGRDRSGHPRARFAALALLVGATAGAVLLYCSRTSSTQPRQASYSFYTLYDGLPWLLWTDKTHDSEYARYQDSAKLFGTAAENGGSVARALIRHPFPAVLRVALKPLDWIATLTWIGSLTPIGIVLAVVGARSARRRKEIRVPFLAYLAPAAILLVPAATPPYFIAVAAPLFLAVAVGAESLLERARWTPSWTWAAVGLPAASALIAVFGKSDLMNSRSLNSTAAWLSERCAQGCVTNVLPQSIRTQAWIDLDGPLAALRLTANDERSILANASRLVPFADRITAARASARRWPVLYVDVRVNSFAAWEPTFDSTSHDPRLIGAQLVEEARFESGVDSVVVYEVVDDSWPGQSSVTGAAGG